MDSLFNRDELLEQLNAIYKDGRLQEELQALTDEQLMEIAAPLGDLANRPPERRAEARRYQLCRVEVEIPLGGDSFDTQTGLQEDRSAQGASILVPKRIREGTRVKVRRNGEDAVGTVQRCERDGFGYAIGVRYDPA